MSLNNQLCLVRVTLNDLDPSKLNWYYPYTAVSVNIEKVYPFIMGVVELLMIYLIDYTF